MNSYTDIFHHIVSQYNENELIQICKVLNRTYNIYDSENMRWNKIQYVLSRTSEEDFAKLRNSQLSNRVISDLIFDYYQCERVVKYYLIKKFMTMKNHIVAFEMTIGSSRIDVCRINGSSYAYEIKTAYDTYDRLESQLRDYCKAFEHVYVVVPLEAKQEAYDNIPKNCGLITYNITGQTAKFSYARKSIVNNCDIMTCIKSLSSNDLSLLMKLSGIKSNATLKHDKIDIISSYSKAHNIWPYYKKLLKLKYQKKWQFIVQKFDEIIPIDIQNFFSSTILPSLAYYKKSV